MIQKSYHTYFARSFSVADCCCFNEMAKAMLVIIVLTLSSHISTTDSESIYGKCSNAGYTFNCSGVGLADIPDGEHIPSYMKELDFSYNHISNVTFLNYPALSSSLSTIDLSNNQISVLKNDAFKLLTNLNSLDLSNNLISGTNLVERMFFDLKRLHHLNMEKNPLRRLKKDTFSFMELPAVDYLDLSHCEISEMEVSSLDLPSLQYLDLSWNKLQSFDKESFRMLVNLKTLDMSHNRVSVLNQVPYIPALVTWILDSNGMETVEIREGLEDYAEHIESLYLR